MDAGILTALITSGGLLVGGLAAVFVKRSSDNESSKTTGSNAFLDQLQEQGALDREAAAKARAEADAARQMLATAEERFRTSMSDTWREMEALQQRQEDMRKQHRMDLESDDAYIQILIDHINARREPPPPARPNRRTS